MNIQHIQKKPLVNSEGFFYGNFRIVIRNKRQEERDKKQEERRKRQEARDKTLIK